MATGGENSQANDREDELAGYSGNRVDSYRYPRIRRFLPNYPNLWSFQFESSLNVARITTEIIKAPVSTFGENPIDLDSWNFCVAAVPHPILGVDFLAHFQLVPVLLESRSVGTLIGLSTAGVLKNTAVFDISLID